MQTENPAGRILYVTGNPNSNRLIILKEEKALYQKVDTNLNFVDREKKVEEFWKENHIFEKSMENRKEGPTYTFYDGPPTANGKPHIGHVLTRVIKDMIPRYRAMKGYIVQACTRSRYTLPVTGEFRYLLLVPSEIKLRSDLRLNLLAAGLHHPRLAEKIAAVCTM